MFTVFSSTNSYHSVCFLLLAPPYFCIIYVYKWSALSQQKHLSCAFRISNESTMSQSSDIITQKLNYGDVPKIGKKNYNLDIMRHVVAFSGLRKYLYQTNTNVYDVVISVFMLEKFKIQKSKLTVRWYGIPSNVVQLKGLMWYHIKCNFHL